MVRKRMSPAEHLKHIQGMRENTPLQKKRKSHAMVNWIRAHSKPAPGTPGKPAVQTYVTPREKIRIVPQGADVEFMGHTPPRVQGRVGRESTINLRVRGGGGSGGKVVHKGTVKHKGSVIHSGTVRHTGGRGGNGNRIRAPPLFNEKEEHAKIQGFTEGNWGALPKGLEHFRKHLKSQPWKHSLMKDLSWNPLKADFVGYHGIKFLDNTRLKALTRLRKRQMMRRYAVAEEAEKRHKTTQKATGINAKYKQDLEAQVAEMKHANEQLWQARERVGKKGGPSLLQYERMLKEYAQRELRYHEAVGEGGSIHVKYSNTVGDLGKAANSQRGDIQNELRPMRHVRRDIRADRRKQTVQRRMEGQKGRGGEMKAARANLDRKLTQRNQQRRRYEKSA